jgi:hypothetical protein
MDSGPTLRSFLETPVITSRLANGAVGIVGLVFAVLGLLGLGEYLVEGGLRYFCTSFPQALLSVLFIAIGVWCGRGALANLGALNSTPGTFSTRSPAERLAPWNLALLGATGTAALVMLALGRHNAARFCYYVFLVFFFMLFVTIAWHVTGRLLSRSKGRR